jgi:hypothetical protein
MTGDSLDHVPTALERTGIVATSVLAILFAIVGGAAPTVFVLHLLSEQYSHLWRLLIP